MSPPDYSNLSTYHPSIFNFWPPKAALPHSIVTPSTSCVQVSSYLSPHTSNPFVILNLLPINDLLPQTSGFLNQHTYIVL
ncbi:unnamed protein product [Gordionus sp. m RMFG-2023]